MPNRPGEPMTAVDTNSPLAELPPDALVLVTGPPMTGKYELMLYLLAGNADSAIVISTKHQAERVRNNFRAVAGEVPDDHIGVIDCVSYHESVGAVTETASLKYASSPENLTRIGVKFTELFEAFYGDPARGRTGVGIHSLSQLLMHSNLQVVYQFLQVLTGQLRSAEWLAAAVIDEGVAETEQLQTLQHHFDGVVQTRESDEGHREFRVKGFGPSATAWRAF